MLIVWDCSSLSLTKGKTGKSVPKSKAPPTSEDETPNKRQKKIKASSDSESPLPTEQLDVSDDDCHNGILSHTSLRQLLEHTPPQLHHRLHLWEPNVLLPYLKRLQVNLQQQLREIWRKK